jgi:hypothetical protein
MFRAFSCPSSGATTTAVAASGFYRWSVVVAVLLVVVGPPGRPDYDQQHCYHHTPTVKPEAATPVVELLMMDVRTPETY